MENKSNGRLKSQKQEEVQIEKVSFQVNKETADHPHFHNHFLRLVAKFEDSKDIICNYCGHRKFDHVKSGQNGYCQVCYNEGKDCKTLKKYFNKEIKNDSNS